MKILVEVPGGKYCEHCVFLEIPCAYTHNCRLLDHKSLDANPCDEVRNGKTVWVQHIAKDSQCPAIRSSKVEMGCWHLNDEFECDEGKLISGKCPHSCVFYDDGSQ